MKPQDPEEKPIKPNRPVEEFVIKSYTLKEMKIMYGYKRNFFNDCLAIAGLELDGRRILYPKEVERFVDEFGLPEKTVRRK